jgi:ubiquinone/menaquinone biosynthesis C-methylase UbiE
MSISSLTAVTVARPDGAAPLVPLAFRAAPMHDAPFALDLGVPMASADEIRDTQRTTWAMLSTGWDKWDAIVMGQLAPVGAAIIDGLGIVDGQQHLDIATGTGEPGLTIAGRMPAGRVVLTDLVPEMLDIAARRAAERGIANIETQVCSADDLPFADATFDSISVRFGYMFFPDMARATAEFARVLKPGGRVCASVWVKPEANPWTSIAMQAVATEIAIVPPDPTGPNMFRCAAPGYISTLYEAAGLGGVSERDVEVALVADSPAQYWELISEHVSPVVTALKRLERAAHERIRAHAIAGVSPFESDGSVRVPGLARCIVGIKPV